MANAAKKILGEIRKKEVVKVMYYLDKDLQKDFKSICKKNKIKMSDLVEKLIKNFMSDLSK